MTFINKKEEVVKIELTQFGKRLLSKGNFKPEYYQFFDDDIIYDGNYGPGDEHQNNIQARIKDSIRLDVQYSVTNLEEKLTQETKQIESGLADLFEEIKHSVNTTEKEKLLLYPLGDINLGSQHPPMFELISLETEIHNSGSGEYFLTQSGIPGRIPQINFEPVHKIIRDVSDTIDDTGILYDSETYMLDFTSNELQFLNNSTIQYVPENVAVTLEETAVPFTKENFEFEIYEVHTDAQGEELFVQITDMDEIMSLFEIKVDSSVESAPQRKFKNRSFFSG